VGDDQPVVAFEWPGLNGTQIPLDSVTAMTELYLDELRARYAHGPYRVLGWCGGAPVAWEIVHRLRAAGEEVEFSLLDPVCDLWFEETVGAELALFRRCEELFGRLLPGLPETERRAVRAEIVDIMRSVVDDDRGTPVAEESFDESWHQRVRVWRRMLEVQLVYRFTAMPGSLRLIVGDEVASGEHEVIQGRPLDAYIDRWRALVTGGLDVQRTPGDHFTVLRPPHVANLAGLVAPTPRRAGRRQSR
jgi:thioesterase domain-containing protein